MPKIKIPKKVTHILQALESSGFKAYVVGGCVRDSLLGLKPKDWDITTNAKPKQIIEVFKLDSSFKILTTGEKFGTISLYDKKSKNTFEVTTFRIDDKSKNHRHPDSITFTTSLKDDLKRRDFSINALAFSQSKNKIYDYHNGIKDLKKRVISCIGDPNERFCEDGLRILRALRFSATLGFSIKPKTKKAILANKNLLSKISKERVQSEFNKLILGDFFKSVEFYEVFGVIFGFCDEVLIKDKKRKFRAMCENIESAPKELCIRLALFFSFMAQAFGTDKDLEFTKENLENLKYQKALIDKVLTLLKYAPLSADKVAIKRLLFVVGVDNFRLLLEFWRINKNIVSKNVKNLKRIFQEILKNNECFSFKNLAINGNDIKQIASDMGCKIDGKDIGMLLQNLLDCVIKEKIENEKMALQKHLKNLLKS